MREGEVRLLARALALSALLLVPFGGHAQPSGSPLPYEVLLVDPRPVGAGRRFIYRVRLPSHYTQSQVEAVARDIVSERQKSGEQVSALRMHFFGPLTAIDTEPDVASVDWAPEGDWAKGASPPPAQYSTFRYVVTYRAPREIASTQLKVLANAAGLAGAPLPEGAKLTERDPGDPRQEIDALEEYALSASAAEVVAFYQRELPPLGWQQAGPVHEGGIELIVAFKKGQHLIAVSAGKDGKGFLLNGH